MNDTTTFWVFNEQQLREALAQWGRGDASLDAVIAFLRSDQAAPLRRNAPEAPTT